MKKILVDGVVKVVIDGVLYVPETQVGSVVERYPGEVARLRAWWRSAIREKHNLTVHPSGRISWNGINGDYHTGHWIPEDTDRMAGEVLDALADGRDWGE